MANIIFSHLYRFAYATLQTGTHYFNQRFFLIAYSATPHCPAQNLSNDEESGRLAS